MPYLFEETSFKADWILDHIQRGLNGNGKAEK